MLHVMSYPLDFVLSNFYNLEMVFSYIYMDGSLNVWKWLVEVMVQTSNGSMRL